MLSALLWWDRTLAQDDETATYTDKASGVIFNTWRPTKDLTFGMALPAKALTIDATEFIGILTCTSPTRKATGWCGVSLGGAMNSNLLLVAYPQQNTILTSFRWATDYHMPAAYTGTAKLTQLSSTVNTTHYSLLFRCQNCLRWNQSATETGSAPTSQGYLLLGWCHATSSPVSGTCPASLVVRQHDNQGIFAARFNGNAVNAAYASWAAKATNTATGSCGDARASTSTTLVTYSTAKATPTPMPPASGSCAKTYTVKTGDYCYLIATNNGITLDQLYRYNPGLVCNPLQIGLVVCVQGR
ncbi:hypothetical protein B0T22DRAFT_493669 [Podospora appendiculata]|uniref:LysM domain-containing protein n=1 Tax=Podospora appendiculata TaxID=314037 RepID=A0AAE1C9G5_9PEZI|nr:hypothetical protein B0T22DRAFT_493669 [Podospora appendiculata]